MIIKLFEEFTYTGVQDHFGLGIKFTDALQQSYLELKNNPNISWAVFDIDNDNFIANSDNYDQNVEGGSVPKAIAGACALHKNGGDFDSTHDMWKLQKLLVNSNNDMWPPIQKLAGGVTSSVLLVGPPTFNSVGNETLLTQNRLLKGAGLEPPCLSTAASKTAAYTVPPPGQ